MPSKVRMTNSARVTHAGPFGVQPHELGYEVWGNDVRPLRSLSQHSLATQQSKASLNSGEADGESIYNTPAHNPGHIRQKSVLRSRKDRNNYATVKAELKNLFERLEQNERRHTSDSSDATITQDQVDIEVIEIDKPDYDTDLDTSEVQESAAARLQRLHERSGRSSPRRIHIDTHPAPAFEAESFPRLGRTPMLMRGGGGETSSYAPSRGDTYARVVNDGPRTTQGSALTKAQPDHASFSPTELDKEWVLLNHVYCNDDQSANDSTATVARRSPARSGNFCDHGDYANAREDREYTASPPSSPQRLVRNTAPRFATEKRAADRHRRKALPEGWSPEGQTGRRTDETEMARNQMKNFPRVETTNFSKSPPIRGPTLGSHRGHAFGYRDEHTQTTLCREQVMEKSPRTLTHSKSHGSLVSRQKSTISKKSTFASPTTASKQRATNATKSGNSPSTATSPESRRLRAGAISVQPQSLVENYMASKKAASRFQDYSCQEASSNFPDYFESSPSNFCEFTHGPRNALDYADEVYGHQRTEQPSSHNGLTSECKKANKLLRINIPPPATSQSRTASPMGISRIPRPAQNLYASLASPATCSGPITAFRVTHDVSNLSDASQLEEITPPAPPPHRVRKHPEQCDTYTQTQFDDDVSLVPSLHMTGERAAILRPIVRRISSAGSQKILRSRSNTLGDFASNKPTTLSIEETYCEPADDHAILEPALKLDNKRVSTQPMEGLSIQHPENIVNDTVSSQLDSYAAVVKSDTSVSSKPCPPESQLTSTAALGTSTASSWLLNTIKQTAVDFAKSQEQGSVETEPAPDNVRVASQFNSSSRSYGPHVRAVSTASLPEQDPAIIEIGPVRNGSLRISAAAPTSSEHDSRVSSLRATACEFVPGALNPSSSHTLIAPVVPKLDEAAPITPIDQQISQRISPPFTRSFPHPTDSEWLSLSPSERVYILEKRRERSSDESCSAMSQLNFGSTLSAIDSNQSLTPSSSATSSPQFDRVGAAQTGSAVKFGRAPLPSMSEEDGSAEAKYGKGWGIGSAVPGHWYGWRGGDGLEIAFVGHGPDAEKFPDAPISFQKYKKGTTVQDGVMCSQQTPRQVVNYADESNDSIPVAPKKMREEWASRMGYTQIPCGEFEVTHAVEHVSSGENRGFVDGWCHGCVPGH